MRKPEKVQEAIINRLQTRTGLDLKSLDVSTTSVTFDKNRAYATVAFHPKNDASVNSGMVMKYTLEARDGNWVVVNVGDSQSHSMARQTGMQGQTLPPGHPPIGGGTDQPGQGSNGRSQ